MGVVELLIAFRRQSKGQLRRNRPRVAQQPVIERHDGDRPGITRQSIGNRGDKAVILACKPLQFQNQRHPPVHGLDQLVKGRDGFGGFGYRHLAEFSAGMRPCLRLDADQPFQRLIMEYDRYAVLRQMKVDFDPVSFCGGGAGGCERVLGDACSGVVQAAMGDRGSD